jgi:hypothetical protein
MTTLRARFLWIPDLTAVGRRLTQGESIKPGELLKAVILPARNGNPAGFIRSLTLADNKQIKLFFGDERD